MDLHTAPSNLQPAPFKLNPVFELNKNLATLGYTTSIYCDYGYKMNYRQIMLRIVGYYFSSRLTATLNPCLIYLILLVHVF